MSEYFVERAVRGSARPGGVRLRHRWPTSAASVQGLLSIPLVVGTLVIAHPAPGVAQGSWTATSTVGAPTGRYSHAAVWTGSRMIVWGGNEGDLAGNYIFVNTGGIYDPATNTWTATSTSGAPAGHGSHSAVWTGSKMIVWGGYDDTPGLSNTGGIYDPATNTWTPTSTTGAPTARVGHTAMWTGSSMIVWGGYDGGYCNTGGIYDPATNTWTPTSTTGAPTGRWGHTAVWTGSKMIVWGGSDGGYSNIVDTGAIYDVATNTWTATSTTEAPTPRFWHKAVWTGSKMVVWGGIGEMLGNPNTGGIYDPATDTWTATSTTGAPFRNGPSAVWTGSWMIIWGGYDSSFDGGFYTNTGRIYDPATDSWMATTTTGAPTGRGHHTAVWTGSRMIVWGGCCGLDTGGIYDPGALSPPGDVQLSNGVPYPDSITSAVRQGAWKYYYLDVPAGATQLSVVLDNLTADVDLYVRSGVKPDSSTFDCRPWEFGTTTETCSLASPTTGRWWIGVNNYDTETIAYRVTATYIVPASHSLSVSKGGTGVGTVTSSPAGINCGSTCSASFASGTTVTLTAAPGSGSTFTGWSGSGCSGTGTCTVFMTAARSVTASFTVSSLGVAFYTVTPCRVLDSRDPGLGGPAPFLAGSQNAVTVAGHCGIPATAVAVSLNVTVAAPTAQGHLRLFPSGAGLALVSTINYVAGQTRANNAVTPLGGSGALEVSVRQGSGSVHVIIDVNGYFE